MRILRNKQYMDSINDDFFEFLQENNEWWIFGRDQEFWFCLHSWVFWCKS